MKRAMQQHATLNHRSLTFESTSVLHHDQFEFASLVSVEKERDNSLLELGGPTASFQEEWELTNKTRLGGAQARALQHATAHCNTLQHAATILEGADAFALNLREKARETHC